MRVRIPFHYALDQLEQRYGQPPGSSVTWDPEALLRALAYQRMEASVKRRRRG